MRKRPPPRPQAIETLLAEIRDVTTGPLLEDYREAYGYAYLVNGWRPESAGKLSTIRDVDPTGNTATDGINENTEQIAGKERIRVEATTAYELLGKALDNLRQAAQAVQRAMPREKKPLEKPWAERVITEAEIREQGGVKGPDGVWRKP